MQTPYILDLNAGLKQVLNDGTLAYVYGLDLVSQQTGIYEEYPLRDTLGSVRQVTDQSSAITGSRNYELYGSLLSVSGEGAKVLRNAGRNNFSERWPMSKPGSPAIHWNSVC